MNATANVLLAIASELADAARENLPTMQECEYLVSERFENGIYYRETSCNGNTVISEFDFKERKSHTTVKGGDGNG